jgi:trigger factor
LTATLRKLDPTQVQLDIEVSRQDLDQARAQVFRRLAQRMRIPGFRPGRAPRHIIEQHVHADEVESEALKSVVPDAYARALEEHHLDPVAHPKIDLERTDEGRGLKIVATVAVKPEIALGTYTGLKATKPPVDVSDADVDASIDSLRRRAATLEPVTDRGIAMGDIVTLDYSGRIDGELFEGGTATNHTTEVSAERFIPGFAEQIEGARSGERRTITVTFPGAYKPERLAGKTATFDVTIHDIKTPVLPAADDAFAAQVSDLPTYEALRAEIRRRVERMAADRSRETVERQLLETLVAAHDFPVPDVLVDDEAEGLVHSIKHQIGDTDTAWHDYLSARQQTEEGLKTQLRPDALRRVKSALLIEAIAKAENIRVTAAEIEREVDALARSSGRSVKETLAALQRSGGLSRVAGAVERHKTLAFLVEKAEVVEAPLAEPNTSVTTST